MTRSKLVRCDNETDIILIQKAKMTGLSKSKLLKFAVFHMPFIPAKKIKNKNDKK